MKMSIELNFKVGEPTVNGRIYSEEVITKLFKNIQTTPVVINLPSPIVLNNNDNIDIEAKNIAGFAVSYEILEDKRIMISIELVNNYIGENFKVVKDITDAKLSIAAFVKTNEYMIVKDDAELICFLLESKYDKESIKQSRTATTLQTMFENEVISTMQNAVLERLRYAMREGNIGE